ncbi:MAG: hypothetical protein CFE23_14500 [Flavobacterium sp. BFFFF1]|uniref:hypothetical protein n=1 Tax=Flavobacterium sp. BFFFF1 TaxID=2015557 RepID=UPI000BCED88B|nr:hypothetical protein [Flavobacterium sp. BFFFF1]OYU79375.1 MAG: hypothetical protein CFE23_14500 [Flavobacterium sp. BFFFF1]
MNLSSKTTYLFPCLILYLSCIYISYSCFSDHYSGIDFIRKDYMIFLWIPVVIAGGMFFVFRGLAKGANLHYTKYLLIAVPVALEGLAGYVTKDYYPMSIYPSIVDGLLLYFAFMEFLRRCTAFLREDAIVFKNLLGYTDEIPLTTIVKLEQKANLLSFIREFRILNLARKTIVTYKDEAFQEFEIKFFTKVFKEHEFFDEIIAHANARGNLKIKMYSY